MITIVANASGDRTMASLGCPTPTVDDVPEIPREVARAMNRGFRFNSLGSAAEVCIEKALTELLERDGGLLQDPGELFEEAKDPKKISVKDVIPTTRLVDEIMERTSIWLQERNDPQTKAQYERRRQVREFVWELALKLREGVSEAKEAMACPTFVPTMIEFITGEHGGGWSAICAPENQQHIVIRMAEFAFGRVGLSSGDVPEQSLSALSFLAIQTGVRRKPPKRLVSRSGR